MGSLSDLSQIVGFFSYSRNDDEDSDGALSQLRDRIYRELRQQIGRRKEEIRLWQDTQAISVGKLWEAEIKAAIKESVFFIPIISPSAVKSTHCRFEFESFLEREKELGRNDLVFPIHYVPVQALGNEALWRNDPVLSIVGRRQYADWVKFRHEDIRQTEVRRAVESFCSKIVAALEAPWNQPEPAKAVANKSVVAPPSRPAAPAPAVRVAPATPAPRPAPPAASAAAPAILQGPPTRGVFDSLEEEMASLLGRPSPKRITDAVSPSAPKPSEDMPRRPDRFPYVRTRFMPVPDGSPRPSPRAAPVSTAVLKNGVIDGMAYTLYADGAIEAELPSGKVRFANVDALRDYLNKPK